VLGLFKGLRGKKRNGPAAATVQQPAEPEQFQPLRDGEWRSQATGPVPAAGLAPSRPIPSRPVPSHPIPSHPIPSHPIPSHPIPSHPIPPIPSLSTCPRTGWDRGRACPPNGRAPSSGHLGGCPCWRSAGLACVLWPLPRPLSSGCAHSLPDAAKEQAQEQDRPRGRFRRAAQVP
ncbi:unnamed protein product, partial [Coccothraustes coccothraustes]